MTSINYAMFYNEYDKHSDCERLFGVLGQIDYRDLIAQIEERRNHSGRRDWPVESMLRA